MGGDYRIGLRNYVHVYTDCTTEGWETVSLLYAAEYKNLVDKNFDWPP